MKEVKTYTTNKVYVLANDETAKEILQQALDGFMDERDNESFIFVAYHVRDEIILLHMKKIGQSTSFDEAIELIKQDVLNGDVRANDVELKEQLNDPQATTAALLWEYLMSI